MRHSRDTQVGAMSLTGILVAAAAFGLGYYLGSRGNGTELGRWIGRDEEDGRLGYRRRNMGYRGGHRLDDTDDATTLDNYHRHLSESRPGAPAGTPPDADLIVGGTMGHKSARESAAVLYDQDGRPIRSPETTGAGSTASRG